MLFSVLQFRFVYFLTLLHVLTTMLGMQCFSLAGMYQKRSLPVGPLLALSVAFVGYIVMWNLSLQVPIPPFCFRDIQSQQRWVAVSEPGINSKCTPRSPCQYLATAGFLDGFCGQALSLQSLKSSFLFLVFDAQQPS